MIPSVNARAYTVVVSSLVGFTEGLSANETITIMKSHRGLIDRLVESSKMLFLQFKRVSDCLCAGAWFRSRPRIGLGKPRLDFNLEWLTVIGLTAVPYP